MLSGRVGEAVVHCFDVNVQNWGVAEYRDVKKH